MHVGVAEILIEQRDIGKQCIEEARAQRLELLGNRRQIVRGSGQTERGESEIVGADILPEIVVRAVIEDAISPAHQRAGVSQQIVREAESNGPVVFVGLVDLLVAGPRIHHLRTGEPLAEVCALA